MSDTEANYYGAYLEPLKQCETEILSTLEQLLQPLNENQDETIVEHILSRIKSPESMQEKLRKKNLPTDATTALTHTADTIGIRLVTHFVGDVYKIQEVLRNCQKWKVIKEKDYIAMPKENGYRSLHIIIEIPFSAHNTLQVIQAEIQLRTIAMDCWASLEHQMKYKKNIPNAALLISELKRCADEMASTDLTMQTIREQIHQKHETSLNQK